MYTLTYCNPMLNKSLIVKKYSIDLFSSVQLMRMFGWILYDIKPTNTIIQHPFEFRSFNKSLI